MEVTKTELLIPCKDGKLYGILYHSDETCEKSPVVIVSHGFYSSYEMMAKTAQHLAEKGYVTYCFDYQGCSYSRKSGGSLLTCSIQTEIENLSTIIAYFKNESIISDRKIFLAGQSMGGVVSALTAVRKQKDIAGLILMCPAMNMKETCRQYYPEGAMIPDVTENFIGVSGLNLGRKFFVDLFATDFEEMFYYKNPVYLLHGTADEMVPIEYSENLSRRFQNNKYVRVLGAKHYFSLDENQAEDIREFFAHNC